METIKTNCPKCKKLYSVNSDDVKESHPQFKCVDCFSRFSFMMPQLGLTEDFQWEGDSENKKELKIKARLIDWQEMPEFVGKDVGTEVDKDVVTTESVNVGAVEEKKITADLEREIIMCGKCHTKNPIHPKQDNLNSSIECLKCGFIFLKEKFKASERVRKIWQEVLLDYESILKHHQFFQISCSELALPYAVSKYQGILNADPTEEIAIEMREQIVTVSQLWIANKKSFKKINSSEKWKDLLFKPFRLLLFFVGSFSLTLFFAISFFNHFQ